MKKKRKIKIIFAEYVVTFLLDEFEDTGEDIIIDAQMSVDALIDMCNVIEGDEDI